MRSFDRINRMFDYILRRKQIPYIVALLLILNAVLYGQDTIVTKQADESNVNKMPRSIKDTSVLLDKIELTAKKVHPTEGNPKNGYRYSKAQLGPLGEIPIKDLPFSVNVTSASSIENRSAHILADALQSDAAAFPVQQPHTDGRGGSELQIRGFDPSYELDGLAWRNYLPVRMENIDRVEVFNGLSGFLYGFSTPGGIINFVEKKPVAESIGAISLGQYNGGVNYINADIGGPVTFQKKLTFRVNTYLEDGTTFIGGASQRGNYVSGALGYKLFDSTSLMVRASHQDMWLQGQQAAFSLDPIKVTVPSAATFDPEKLYGQKWTYVKGKEDMVGGAIESKLGNVFTLRGAYNYNMVWRKNNGVAATLIDNAGNYKLAFSDGAPSDAYEHSAYALVDAKFDSWKIHHSITAGWMYNGYTQKNNAISIKNIQLGTFNIAHPKDVAMPDTVSPTPETVRTVPVFNSAIIGDMLSFGKVFMLAGVNYTVYDYRTENLDTGLIKKFSQSNVSPSVALIFKPQPFISAYASYIQGVSAGGYSTTPYAKNINEVLPPDVHDQYEIGVKGTVLGRLDLTADGFIINKVNEFLDLADSVYKQDGREIHQGIEVSATGTVIKRLMLGGGATLMDAQITKSSIASLNDKVPVNVPQKLARLFAEYEFAGLPGVNVLFEAQYSGSRYIDDANTASIPSVTTYNAGLRYEKAISSHKLAVNVHITNMLNTTYWAAYKAKGTPGLCLGAPRTISLSAKYGW